MNDGGSKLYKYNKVNKLFGNKDFYVIICNSTDGIKDIFVAKNINSLNDKCTIKTNDLEGITMNIKEKSSTTQLESCWYTGHRGGSGSCSLEVTEPTALALPISQSGAS